MPSATTVTKGIRGDFGWMFQLLSALMSTLAIVALARHAFVTWSLSAPLSLVMDAYNATMQVLLGWAQPYLQAALTWLGGFIGWRPTLYPHWRDVFVIMGLAAAPVARGGAERGIFAAIYTLAVALVAGVLPLQSEHLVGAVLTLISLGLMYIMVSAYHGHEQPWRRTAGTAGLIMLGGFVGAFAFFTIDAGLKLLMG